MRQDEKKLTEVQVVAAGKVATANFSLLARPVEQFQGLHFLFLRQCNPREIRKLERNENAVKPDRPVCWLPSIPSHPNKEIALGDSSPAGVLIRRIFLPTKTYFHFVST